MQCFQISQNVDNFPYLEGPIPKRDATALMYKILSRSYKKLSCMYDRITKLYIKDTKSYIQDHKLNMQDTKLYTWDTKLYARNIVTKLYVQDT